MMFYDYDQSSQIELHYQNCVNKIEKFGASTHMVGDVNMQQNGWQYDVKGQDARAGVADTTWT